MSTRIKFALTLVVMFALAVGAVASVMAGLWSAFSDEEKALVWPIFVSHAGVLPAFAFLLAAGLFIILQGLFKSYIGALRAVAEEVQTIASANPGHRIKPRGGAELHELIERVNAFADRHQALQADVEIRINEAKASVEEEKNRLAALMSELTQSVLVCNLEGRILLYNARAKQIFHQPADAGGSGSSLVGLGRSVFGIVEKSLIVHALDSIHQRLGHEKADPVCHFVTTTKSGLLIRALMAPVLDRDKEMTGYVLTLEDITRTLARSSRRDVLLQQLTEGTRASLANIRAAVETLQTYGDMAPERQLRFIEVISDEARQLSEQLDRTVAEHADSLKMDWPLEDMLGNDLISALRRRLETRLGVAVEAEPTSDRLWLKVDSYSVVRALTHIMGRLRDEYGVRACGLRLREAGRYARLDMLWQGTGADSGALHDWESRPLLTDGEGSPLTFGEVAERHGSEAWCQVDKASNTTYCRLMLPLSEPGAGWSGQLAIESRPEYYDFDLFHQPGQNPQMDERLLTDLSYTVFDTETTGLEPSRGDEIISIGAVRIVNGRLLYQESFEQLVDPQRGMSQASIRIHGIQPEMLHGKPTIDQVLPTFHQYCEDTVLVAHNAAFDMRFLQLKEQRTGLRFTHPVVDTLLLSAVVHPNQESHKLEAIAERLGVNVIGRHTSLGDAIVTAEVFLKMIPLLNRLGIHTLGQAREAAKKTYYARIEY